MNPSFPKWKVEWFLAILFCLLAACGPSSSAPSDFGDDDRESAPPQCRSDFDCPGDLICSPDFFCVDPNGMTDGDAEATPADICEEEACLWLESDRIDFGRVAVENEHRRDLVILNNGAKPLRILAIDMEYQSHSAAFRVEAEELSFPVSVNAGALLAIPIYFTPSDPEAAEARLRLNSSAANRKTQTVDLLGNLPAEAISLEVSPLSLHFGDVEADGSKASVAVNFRLPLDLPEGEKVEINRFRLSGDGEFTFEDGQRMNDQGFLLGAGESRQILVYYAPEERADHYGELAFAHNATDILGLEHPSFTAVHIPLAGRGVVPCLSVDPPRADFGNVSLDRTVTVGVHLKSLPECGSPVIVREIRWENGENSALFLDGEEEAIDQSILPGSTEEFLLACRPRQAGVFVDNLEIVSNDRENPVRQIPVTCVGAEGVLSYAPRQISFEATEVGYSIGAEITFKNNGGGALILREAAVSAPEIFQLEADDAEQWPVRLESGEEWRLRLLFSPEGEPERYTETLTVETDQTETPSHEITLLAVSLGARMELTDPEEETFDYLIDFGQKCPGIEPERVIRMKNVGSAPLVVDRFELDGNSSLAFDLTPEQIPGLPSGEETRFQVRFKANASAGVHTGTIRIDSNDYLAGRQTVGIVGKAITRQLKIQPFGIFQNPYDIGAVPVETFSDPVPIRLSNRGNDCLKVHGVYLANTYPMESWSLGCPDPAPECLRNRDDHPEDEYVCFLSFRPLAQGVTQYATVAVHTNDCDNPTSTLYFKGSGSDCPPGTVDLDPGPGLDCYECYRPTPESQVPYEICDGYDNDCDGTVDEGFEIGIFCEGVGVCPDGVMECRDIYRSTCSTGVHGSAYIGTEEICDGLDNDCDGITDNHENVGVACIAPMPCGIGAWECRGNELYCNSLDRAEPERCDGVDNDCNGQTDDGAFNYVADDGRTQTCDDCVGKACFSGSTCLNAVWTCAPDLEPAGQWIRCVSPVDPSPEVCDGLDNDCDGYTDEDFNLGEPCEGVGQCGSGVFQCNPYDNTEAICSTDIGGSEYPNLPELCDGLDNNCNGEPDENFPVGVPCWVGGCMGTWQCHPRDGSRVICDIPPWLEAPPERCNGVDDDCDGSIDEDFGVGEPCEGVGECGLGVWECDPEDDSKRICSTDIGGSQYAGQVERCDALDNDCDEDVDEIYPVGQPCETYDGTPGTYFCDPENPYSVRCEAGGGFPDGE